MQKNIDINIFLPIQIQLILILPSTAHVFIHVFLLLKSH